VTTQFTQFTGTSLREQGGEGFPRLRKRTQRSHSCACFRLVGPVVHLICADSCCHGSVMIPVITDLCFAGSYESRDIGECVPVFHFDDNFTPLTYTNLCTVISRSNMKGKVKSSFSLAHRPTSCKSILRFKLQIEILCDVWLVFVYAILSIKGENLKGLKLNKWDFWFHFNVFL
jgi:hypothetical protein